MIMEIGGLEWCIEAKLGDGHSRVAVAFSGLRSTTRAGDHMLAFETATIHATGEGAGAVPWRVEHVVTAFELRG